MTKRRAYFWFVSIVTVLCAITLFAYQNPVVHNILPAQAIQPGFYKVLEVYDGDTIAVDMNGVSEKVRFIGVDTPETHKPNTPVQCFGPQASEFTTNLLRGQAVRLETDPTNSNRDRYDRLLRYVYLSDGTLVDQLLITRGYGFAYLSFPFEKADDFAATQAEAQDQKVGVWANCTPQLTKGRWLSNTL